MLRLMSKSVRGTRAFFTPVRSMATVPINFKLRDGSIQTVDADLGETLLDICKDNDLEVEGACEGECACSTCHLIFEQELFDTFPEIEEEEEDMLDLAAGLTDTSRLGCQVTVTENMANTTIKLPDEVSNMMG